MNTEQINLTVKYCDQNQKWKRYVKNWIHTIFLDEDVAKSLEIWENYNFSFYEKSEFNQRFYYFWQKFWNCSVIRKDYWLELWYDTEEIKKEEIISSKEENNNDNFNILIKKLNDKLDKWEYDNYDLIKLKNLILKVETIIEKLNNYDNETIINKLENTNDFDFFDN